MFHSKLSTFFQCVCFKVSLFSILKLLVSRWMGFKSIDANKLRSFIDPDKIKTDNFYQFDLCCYFFKTGLENENGR